MQRPCVNSGAIRVPDVGACVAAPAQEIDELCDAWQPQPLVSAEDVKKVVQRKERVVTRQSGSRVTINGKVRVCSSSKHPRRRIAWTLPVPARRAQMMHYMSVPPHTRVTHTHTHTHTHTTAGGGKFFLV